MPSGNSLPSGAGILTKKVGPLFFARWSTVLGAVLCVFFPYVINGFVSAQVLLVVFMGLLSILEVGARKASFSELLLVTSFAIATVILVLALTSTFADSQAPLFVSKMQQYVALLPMGVLAGWALSRSQYLRGYAQLFVLVALVCATIGVFEYATQSTVFGRTALLSTLGGKAIVAADHPLVLGVLIATAIALVRPSGIKHPRIVALALFVGAFATQTTGPSAIAALLLLLVLFPKLEEWLEQRTWIIAVGVIVVVLFLAYLAFFVWEPEIIADDLNGYSFQYRTAMYALLPDILVQVPFGYGFAGMPEATWFLPSSLRGIRDLSFTIDSEIVYLVSELGIAGLLAFMAVLGISLRALKDSFHVGVFALVLTVAGFFVALHAFGSLASVWIIAVSLAGFSARLRKRTRSEEKLGPDVATPHALSARKFATARKSR